MSRGPGRSGFTLVEILLALAIFATILLLLLSAFTGAERVREMLSGRSRDFRQVRNVLDRLGSDLSGAFSSDKVADCAMTCREDLYSGKRGSTLVFTALVLPDASEARPAGDLVKLKYYPKPTRDGRFIELYREQSDLPLIGNRFPTRESRIAERLLGFRVELLDGEKWVKEWPPAGGKKSSVPKRTAFVLTDSRGQEYRRVVPLVLAGQETALPFSGKRPGKTP